jgi:hypothetical protein
MSPAARLRTRKMPKGTSRSAVRASCSANPPSSAAPAASPVMDCGEPYPWAGAWVSA